MDINLKRNFENAIKVRSEKDFELFIKELHFEKYGITGFISTRETKDKGSDGIVTQTKTVIACYGPQKYTKTKFDKKADEDFEKYLKYWVNNYLCWEMYFNGDISPDQIFKINGLKDLTVKRGFSNISVEIRGTDHIVKIIENDLKNIQIRRLAKHLNIPKELFVKDYIREVLDDLLRVLSIQLKNVEYNLKVDIEEKISINYKDEEIADAKREYEELAINGTLRDIENALSIYEDEEINKLKFRIIKDISEFGGNFNQKLNSLTNKYAVKYSSGQDDDFDYNIRAILVYCFEQCIIGIKTPQEKEK
jgi:hypothetical protein